MNIVFMGTPDFAVPSLTALIDGGHNLLAVYTQPDKPQGRKMVLTAPPVKELALAHNIPVYQPTKMKDGTVAAQLRELAPDLIVVVAYGRLLPKEILEVPTHGCINVHGSLLPKYRGAAPIQWAVINGEKETGVTTMYMAEGLDTGDMLHKLVTPIGENETSGELFDRLSLLGAQCLAETLELLEKQALNPEQQDEEQASFAPQLRKEMGGIDFTKTAQQVHDHIRGMHPWPVAHTRIGRDKGLKILRARPCDGRGAPGTVLDAENFVVACGEGAIQFLEVQPEGGKRMDAKAFLNGRPLIVGKTLTDIS